MILWVLILVTAAVPQDKSRIIFSPEEMFVNLNEKTNIDCGFQGSYRYCIWEHMGGLFDTVDIHEGIYPGLSKPENIEGNQCGIVLDSASNQDHGEWTCKVFIKGDAIVGSKNVTILVPPTQAKVTPSDINAKANEETMIECIIMEARPAVQIMWLLDEEDITQLSQAVDTIIKSEDTFMTVSTLNITFTPIDSKKELKCVVDHQTLEESEIVAVSVNVLYAPAKAVLQNFSPNENDIYEIKVNFSANPKPFRMLWQYGESFDNLTSEIKMPLDAENISSILENGINGHFIAVLNISSLNETDFKRHYNLLVENEIGITNYQLMLEPVTVNQENDKTVMTAVVITGALVLIIGLITVIGKTCIANKVLVIATLQALPICCPPKESQPNIEKETNVSNGDQPVIINVIVKDDGTEKEIENGNGDTGNLVGEVVNDPVDVNQVIEDSENPEST